MSNSSGEEDDNFDFMEVDDNLIQDDDNGGGGDNDNDLNEDDVDVEDNQFKKQKKRGKVKGQGNSGNKLQDRLPISARVVNQLKESQNLYQSNLYRFQINELLTEIQVKASHRTKFENWLKDFKGWLPTVDVIDGLPIEKLKKLKRKLNIKHLPLPANLHPGQDSKLGLFKWVAPTVITPVGSWALGSAISKVTAFDIVIEIPKECLNNSDYLNHKYHIKRALYLSYLGTKLQERGDNVQFCCPNGNLLEPVLEIQLSNSKALKVLLHFIPPSGLFKIQRFDSDTNNVRFEHFFKTTQHEDEPVFSTPVYNQTILGGLLMLQNHGFVQNLLSSSCGVTNTNNICEAIKLLKVWLEQRHFNRGYGAFSNYIMTMYVCYLLLQKKISNTMSSYQIIRVVFVNIVKSDWLKKGISHGECDDAILAQWFLQYDIVFLDSTGHINFTCNMSKYTYNRVKLEAQLALNILNSSEVSGFQTMFIKDVPFSLNFDHVLQIRLTPSLKAKLETFPEYKAGMLSTSGNLFPLAVSIIGQLIETCLRRRVELIDFEMPDPPVWSLNDKTLPIVFEDFVNIKFGIVINKDFAYKLLEKCESEAENELEAFKEFWGEKSELRRFVDGTIVESVSFESEKHNFEGHVCFAMLQYILKKHLNIEISEQELEINDEISSGYYLDKQLENVIEPTFEMIKLKSANTNGEMHSSKRSKMIKTIEPPLKKIKQNQRQAETERIPITVDGISKLASAALDSLSKMLRDLEDLPLSITSVQSTSTLLRYTNVHPTPPQVYYSSDVLTSRNSDTVNSLSIRENLVNKVPKYNEAIDVIVQLETSGKWPDDLQAIQRLKCGFLLRIGELLNVKFGLTVQVFPTHIQVIKEGFLFSIRLTYYREVILLKQLRGEDGILRLRNNLEALHEEKSTLLLPKLSSILHSFNNEYPAFGKTCRIVKRWVASHMLLASKYQASSDLRQPDYCLTEEAIELLVASIFLNHSPYLTPPNEAQTGFLRLLVLLTTTDWNSIAIIVNFGDAFSQEDKSQIETEFTKRRSTLPTPYISYPDDKQNSLWTKNLHPIIWKRIATLGRQALELLMTHFQHNSCSRSFDSANLELDPFRSIFKPDLSQFDIIIRIKKNMNCNQRACIQARLDTAEENGSGQRRWKQQCKEYIKLHEETIPIVDFDPIQSFLLELRQNFGHFGLFLYDVFGGELIAFIWKPDVLRKHEFKISSVKGQMLQIGQSSNSTPTTRPNVNGLIELFEILGDGIVDSVEAREEFIISD